MPRPRVSGDASAGALLFAAAMALVILVVEEVRKQPLRPAAPAAGRDHAPAAATAEAAAPSD